MGICIYCGSSWETEDDHVIAKSKGGKRTMPACQACNRSKGNKPVMVWLRWLKNNNLYRWDRIKKYNYRKKNSIARKVQKIRDEG